MPEIEENDDLVEKINGLNVGDDDLPDELKHLIEEAANEEAPAEDEVVEASANEITTADLLNFFNTAIENLRKKSTADSVRDGMTKSGVPLETPQERMEAIRKQVEETYNEYWKQIGVDETLGKHAVVGVNNVLQNEEIDLDFRRDLQEKVKMFSTTEQGLVQRVLFGEKMFQERQDQQLRIQEKKKKLIEMLKPLSKEERGAKVMELKNEALQLRTKLTAMGEAAAADYLSAMKGEENEIMENLSALAMLIQEGSSLIGEQPGHAHSHGGAQCNHDHGHSHAAPQNHGHSHGGVPCQGHHGQPQAAQQHGHSHEGHDHGHSH